MTAETGWIAADWPAPAAVRAGVTTRQGGVSQGPFRGFNLADHVGDDPAAVAENRAQLRRMLQLPAEPDWLKQVHGVGVRSLPAPGATADASISRQPGQVCAVLSADCLPVLLCDRRGLTVAAAHAGWRGLAAGVIRQTVLAMQCQPAELMAWLGPAIGPAAFEVGDDVNQAFLAEDAGYASAFAAGTAPGKWQLDLYAAARRQLAALGVSRVFGGGFCTYHDAQRFYSYRRDRQTGRMASLIWISPADGL